MTTITITVRVPNLDIARLRAIAATIRIRPVSSRATAWQCTACRTWVPPRRFHLPRAICRDCHRGPTTRHWTRRGST
jgi:hypothetical protein